MKVSVGTTIEMLFHRWMLLYNCSVLPPVLFLNLHESVSYMWVSSIPIASPPRCDIPCMEGTMPLFTGPHLKQR